MKADGLLAELVIHPAHAAHTAPRHGRRAQSFFGLSATIASVVTRRPATELASCKATLTTLAGSIMPFLIRSPYSPVWASKPKDGDYGRHLADHDRALDASILGDLADWRLQRPADDVDAGFLVFIVAFDL